MKMTRGLWLSVLAGLVLCVGAATAKADSITTFNLNNVSFQDGATASGFLTVTFVNCGTCPGGFFKQLTNWDVDVTGGTDLGAGNAIGFDPADSSGSLTSDPIFDLLQNDPFQIQLITNEPLGPDTTTLDLTGGSFSNGPTFDSPIDNGGSLDATPEPGTWALLGGGVLLLAGLAWRRRQLGEASNL